MANNKNLFYFAPLFLVAAYFFYSQFNSTNQLNQKETQSEVKGYDSSQIQPLKIHSSYPEHKVALGKRLFFEKRLSKNNTISCASCHDLNTNGADSVKTAIGINGSQGNINTPTVFNSALNFKQFWDGRADSLEQQVKGPVHNPIEMGSNWSEVVSKLSKDNDYSRLFSEVYPEKVISAETIMDAIAAFERTLITPNSLFDQFLMGNNDALNDDEKEGFKRFKEFGCASCHQGEGIGGNMFQKFGVFEGYFEDKTSKKIDLGRFNVTGLDEDRYVFKVPSLRNVAVTAPYFHDGSAESLESAILTMGRYQLGRELTTEDIHFLVAFLKTLTGQWNGHYLQ